MLTGLFYITELYVAAELSPKLLMNLLHCSVSAAQHCVSYISLTDNSQKRSHENTSK